MNSAAVSFRSLRSNAMSLIGAKLVVPVLNLALVVTIARHLGVEELGKYTLLVTAFLLLENLKSFGLPTLLVRDVAREQRRAGDYYRGLVLIGLAGATICVVATGVAARFSLSAALVAPALVMSLGLYPSAYALANDSVCLALGNAQYITAITTAENAARLAISLASVLIFGQGVLALMVVYSLTRLGAAIAGYFVVRRNLRISGGAVDLGLARTMMKSAPEFMTIFAFPILLFRMDVVLLGVLAGDYAVGIYAVAIRLISVCLIIPDSIMSASFAFFSRASGPSGEQEFYFLVQRTIRWMALLLFPVTVGGLLLGPLTIRLLFGVRFDPSMGALKILVWTLVPFAVNRAMGDALVARGYQRTVAKLIGITLLFSVPFYVLAIRAYGVNGAAWGLVVSVGLLCGLTALQAVLRVQIADRRVVASVLVPLVAAVAFFIFTNGSTALVPSVAISALCIVTICIAGLREAKILRENRSMAAN
jgi:O-antigen/teichoic acid export membrane protein